MVLVWHSVAPWVRPKDAPMEQSMDKHLGLPTVCLMAVWSAAQMECASDDLMVEQTVQLTAVPWRE